MFLENVRDTVPGLMRYELLAGEPVDEFSLGVLRQNTPEGVLVLGRETTEDYDHLLLPVADLVPVTAVNTIVDEMLTLDKFLDQVCRVRDTLPQYMVPTEELVLRPEWTWVRPETGDPVLLVLPTPVAKDLSLSMEDYAYLLGRIFAEREQIAVPEKASANESAKRKEPAKPFWKTVKGFWESLD